LLSTEAALDGDGLERELVMARRHGSAALLAGDDELLAV
jgi:hypothetical protein